MNERVTEKKSVQSNRDERAETQTAVTLLSCKMHESDRQTERRKQRTNRLEY